MPMQNIVLDAPLDEIALATIMHVCSADPANYAGIAALSLADVVVDGTDFTKANHTSGRKLTVGAQNAVDVDVSGTSAFIVFAITGSLTLLGSVPCGAASLDSAGQVNIPAFEIRNPDVV